VRPATAQARVAESHDRRPKAAGAGEREDYHHTRVELFHGRERGLPPCRQDAPDCLEPGFMAAYGRTTDTGSGSELAGYAGL
jgi:hypothetical protein